MCGIVGLFATGGGPPPHRELWPQLVNHIRHRGPDDSTLWADGPFVLGHRRLAILDLESGRQPMSTPEGDVVAVFNGEIYDFVERREELIALGHRFRTRSDTEVLLHGYRQWGADLPSHLTGMFAFALADRVRRRLFLARDRFGEKPLFVARGKGYVAFASEVRPLAALPDLERRLDVDALGGFLCLNYVPGDATLLQGVRRLSPAHWLAVDEHGEQSARYWALPQEVAPAPSRSLEESCAAWRERADRAVRFALRSDVPVGMFLSGGIDSSLVAESAVRQGRLSRAYVLDFDEPGFSEREAAEQVANRLGLPLEAVRMTRDDLRDFLKLVEHADDPLADSSALAVWVLSRHAGQHSKVVLAGDGGDEAYAGYLTYAASAYHRGMERWLPGAARSALARLARHLPVTEGKVTTSYRMRRFLRAADLPTGTAHLTWNGTWLPREAGRLVGGGPDGARVSAALGALAARHGTNADPSLRLLQRADLSDYLPNDILVKTDRMSMAHGLEVRAPLLEHSLVSWAWELPDRHKLGQRGELKVLLRSEARRLYGPAIGDRRKQGFSIPVHEWVRGPLAELVRDLLSPESIRRIEPLDPSRIGAVVDAHFSARESWGFELWGLAVLAAWHRARVQKRPDPPAGEPPAVIELPRVKAA